MVNSINNLIFALQITFMETKIIVKEITDFVNTFTLNQEEFNEEMSRQHRTLQQSFTRLCMKWIEHVASDEYQTDLRNESAKSVSKKLIQPFKDEHGYNPSGYLSFI